MPFYHPCLCFCLEIPFSILFALVVFRLGLAWTLFEPARASVTPVTEIVLLQFLATRRRRVLFSSTRCPYLCLYPLVPSTIAALPCLRAA
ncbi:hypothetical protein BJY52DRAFT_1252412 [Lactarius psammicola]|nr:hypothetical protein BJY52DRAFT_1252412 [Lactarius psammicola]